MRIHSSCERAFSLVELSIVLVILGLLTGGILAGQSLIRASELRAVTTEYSRYVSAIGAFRDKYFALPGDMSNATSFWGTASACPGDSTTPSTTAATCNGNGDGKIALSTNSMEHFRAWQHLANAGLVEGSFSGVGSPTLGTVLGSNAPRSKLNNAGWTVNYYGTVPLSDTDNFEGNYGNTFFFGAADASGNTWLNILKPEEAWNIDTKLDDGKPATGMVVSYENAGGSGSTACSDLAPSNTLSRAASVYRLDNTGINCALNMKSGY